jgi:uncharacterized membrane protein YdjX (TVP38/TMEM64 family)
VGKIKGQIASKKIYIIGSILMTIFALMSYLDVFKFVSFENIKKMKLLIDGFGVLGPLIYVVLFITGCVFFIPAPPMAMASGLAFGPVMGSVWTMAAALIADGIAFLLARYTMRNTVESWIQKNNGLQKVDYGVRRHGWRLLILTRLVPGLPYILQSYAYGLTNIKFTSYIVVSWICTIPGIIAFTLMGGCMGISDVKTEKLFIYIGLMAIIVVALSFVPNLIKKRIRV